jgi:nicotinamidase-related amidase
MTDRSTIFCSSRILPGHEYRSRNSNVERLVVIGLIAHTCVEATVRFAAELGYDVTMVRDATADYSDDAMHAALDVNIPNYASAVVTTSEIVKLLSHPVMGVSFDDTTSLNVVDV